MIFPEKLPKTPAIGSVHLEFKRCGKPTCRCSQGLLHGPYAYHRWRAGRVQRKAYVPMSGLQKFVEALDACQAQTPRTCDIRQTMQELNDE